MGIARDLGGGGGLLGGIDAGNDDLELHGPRILHEFPPGGSGAEARIRRRWREGQEADAELPEGRKIEPRHLDARQRQRGTETAQPGEPFDSRRVEAAEINATFLSGHPVVFRVTPVKGGREMRINGRDGGAAIRAANLYGKVAGGQIEFYALMGNGPGSPVENGQLVLRNFQIRNEATLAELDAKGKPKRAGPRSDSLSFKRLTLPFRTDAKFVRIGESIVSGDEIGAIAEGLIRKSDGRIDITGTIIPAYAVNSALGEIPIFGQILTGGKGQGVFGVTFALGGTFESPNFQVNPVSAVAPGFLRKIFEFGGNSAPPRKKADN